MEKIEILRNLREDRSGGSVNKDNRKKGNKRQTKIKMKVKKR